MIQPDKIIISILFIFNSILQFVIIRLDEYNKVKHITTGQVLSGMSIYLEANSQLKKV